MSRFQLSLIAVFIVGSIVVLSFLLVRQPGTQTTVEQTNQDSQYIDYSLVNFNKHQDKNRWLFFHAKWCHLCVSLEKDIRENLDNIPSDVVIFQVDYDQETELKRQYEVRLQTTVVAISPDGQIKTFNAQASPNLAALINNLYGGPSGTRTQDTRIKSPLL